MNIVQLQDMLRGIPDDRLQTEMQTPSGSVPQYLVLSEIVRRDKARSSSADMPKTTVVEDVMNQAQSAGLGALTGAVPMAPEQGMQEAPAMYAAGGFISPADAMGNSGVAGYPQPQQQQPFQLSSQPNPTAGSMFTPNTNPAPTPQTNINLNQQPASDNGVQNNANMPSFMGQPNGYANGYAQGGIVGLNNGGMPQDNPFFTEGTDPVRMAGGDYVSSLIGAESGGNAKAKNPRSSAAGLGQFIDSTWLSFLNETQPGLVDRIGKAAAISLKEDPEISKQAINWYTNKNTNELTRSGFQPTKANLYLSHFLGSGGAKSVLGSDPDASVEGIVGEKVVSANPFLKGMTAKDLMNWTARKMGKGSDMDILGILNNKIMGTPTGMAGRETLAGLGQGAGAAAIGNKGTPIPADPRQGGLLSGIRSLFPEGEKGKEMGSDLRGLGSSMAQGQQAPEAPDAPMKSADISGLDRLRTSPEEDLAQYAALRQQYITGGYADGGTIRMQDGGSPPQEDQRGFMEWIMGVTPEEAAQKRQAEADTAAAEEAKILYEADPERKKRILGERGPLNGDATIPEEAKRIAANSAPSPYQLLAGSQERQQKMLQDYYDSLIQIEKDRMGESQGFGAFLKELGRGMLSNTSAFGPSVAAGAARAVGSREDTAASAREKMNELAMAKKKAQIEGLGALDKLRYEQAVGDGLSSREKAQYGVSALIAALKAAQDPTSGDPDLAKAIQKQLSETMKTLGMGYDVPAPAENAEAESDTGFWSILGKI